jgi:hypothetical protein
LNKGNIVLLKLVLGLQVDISIEVFVAEFFEHATAKKIQEEKNKQCT